jgi:hypothetical protein
MSSKKEHQYSIQTWLRFYANPYRRVWRIYPGMDPLSVSKYIKRKLSLLWSLKYNGGHKIIALMPEGNFVDRITGATSHGLL